MKIKLKKYKEQLQNWPQQGYHIMAQYDDEKIAVDEVRKFHSDSIEKVIFVCFDDENEKIYKDLLQL